MIADPRLQRPPVDAGAGGQGTTPCLAGHERLSALGAADYSS
jgi:hypothetical protein